MVSLPALITLALPDTGAASIWTPREASSARISAEASIEIEVESITSFGLPPRLITPLGPYSTSFTSSPVDTIVKMMSQLARSERLSTTLAPYSFSGSALDFVRFHTDRSHPTFASRAAIA